MVKNPPANAGGLGSIPQSGRFPGEGNGFPLGLTDLFSLLSKGLSRVFFNTTVQNHQFFGINFFMAQLLYLYITTGKIIALTRWTFVGKIMSLLFNMLSRLCWRRLLRVPWTARRSNWAILMEINPEYSLEGLMLKLKLQYFGHLL